MEENQVIEKCPTCDCAIEYGYSHQCYSNIYSKLFESICMNKKTDLDELQNRLKGILSDCKAVRQAKQAELSEVRKKKF
ncbi:unnamed protein product [Moneuplotes crassus]|uniref:Uncharacterized protein n=1 Tax=Euplotes crassus TaxID=5936 RepID=A0AAD2D8L4_EUPCR|nr:unnamed protein product [Moneuplotes crassus]